MRFVLFPYRHQTAQGRGIILAITLPCALTEIFHQNQSFSTSHCQYKGNGLWDKKRALRVLESLILQSPEGRWEITNKYLSKMILGNGNISRWDFNMYGFSLTAVILLNCLPRSFTWLFCYTNYKINSLCGKIIVKHTKSNSWECVNISIYFCLLINLELLAGKIDIFIGEQHKNGLRALLRLTVFKPPRTLEGDQRKRPKGMSQDQGQGAGNSCHETLGEDWYCV